MPDRLPSPAFSTTQLPEVQDLLAPDGSEVRVLSVASRGGMAHFRLQPGRISHAVQHRTVEELWYVLDGSGEIWRSANGEELLTPLTPGTCVTILTGTKFQFRAFNEAPLSILGVTMPPWPGNDEAILVGGKWPASVPSDAASDNIDRTDAVDC